MTRAPHPGHAPPPRRIALVLGGGGMKGFAHIGVMRALEERGITPTVYAGTSIGAMLAAARVGGIPVPDLEARAAKLRRRDLFRLNHFGMLMERMRSPSIYLEEPLRELCRSVVPEGTSTTSRFRCWSIQWISNGACPSSGARRGCGTSPSRMPCMLPARSPGFSHRGASGGRLCMDGGVIDNLPVGVAVTLGRSHHRGGRRQQ